MQYMALGYSVIPVGSNKQPLIKSWKPYQTKAATEDTIYYWWEKKPDANVGIVTGAISNLTVVDIDSYKPGGTDYKKFPKPSLSVRVMVVTIFTTSITLVSPYPLLRIQICQG